VRAGPPLALNLRRALAGGVLQPHRPQARALNLIACGEKTAIASWGPWSAEGRWVWRWKDRIDRAFVARYALPG
jgi:NADH dehydrogenase FAD-containing subunit